MNSETLAARLAESLEEAPRWSLAQLIQLELLLMAVVAAAIAGFYVRDDWSEALYQGRLFWKSGLFALLWAASAGVLWLVVRPAGRLRYRGFYAACALVACVLVAAVGLAQRSESVTVLQPTSVNAMECLLAIVSVGITMAAMVWLLWLRRAAPENPRLAGAVFGLHTGFAFLTVYPLRCPFDGLSYIAVYYLGGTLVLMALGWVCGTRLFRW